MSDSFVSADGSPLAMYLALPAGDEPMIVHAAAGESILELGSGPGRLTRVLVAVGHSVVAVDDAEEMLAHVTGAERVCADVFTLDLRRRFDTVLVASHLINHPARARRRALLDVARRHLSPHGSVLVQRFPPGWPPPEARRSWSSGPVHMTFVRHDQVGDVVRASMIYRLGDSRWEQRFEAVDVDDTMLAVDAGAVGLAVAEVLTDDATWIRLEAGPA